MPPLLAYIIYSLFPPSFKFIFVCGCLPTFMSMWEECWGSQKRASPETGIRIGFWDSHAGPLEEQPLSYLNPCAISPAHGCFMLCIFCPCMYYCMYWLCVTCRSAEFSDLQMVTFSLCTVRKSLGVLRSFFEMHNGLAQDISIFF